MKLKSLLFGSAAAFATVTGAQAADLPIAEPVEYVRICDAFGNGFFYIPGSETCLKIGGFVRADFTYADGDLVDDSDDDFNNYSTRVRVGLNFDARTQTELGILRSYVSLWYTLGTSDFADEYSDSFKIDKAYIQLLMDSGTLTAGHVDSFFDFIVSEAYATRFGDNDPTDETTLIAYTFAFGNGFSATLSLEDPKSASRRVPGESSAFYDPAGLEYPDLVANIRIDQGWGSAQIMGAVGNIADSVGPDDDEIGWAVGAGVKVEIPNTMFSFGLVGEYAKGLAGYVTAETMRSDAEDMWYYNSLELTEAWRIEAMLGAQLTPEFALYLSGSYAHVENDQYFNPGLDNDGFEQDFWTIALTGAWEPVDGLLIGPEIAYISDEEDFSDGSGFDDSAWTAMLRIQRNF